MKRSSGRRARSLMSRAMDVTALLGLTTVLVVFFHDVARREIANSASSAPRLPNTAISRETVRKDWPHVQQRLAGALRQSRLELGAVWATRTGRVCGLVHGWGSFGGLVGMTRFYSVGDSFAFSINPPADFYPNWRQCDGDHWLVLNSGSEEPGFCATRLGQRRCRLGDH